MRSSSVFMASLALVLPASTVASEVTKVDVAGIKLGDTPDQVKAALVKAGYRITYQGQQASFEAEASQRAAARRGPNSLKPSAVAQVASNIMANGPQNADIIVQFAPIVSGAAVTSVNYSVSPEAMTPTAFMQQAVAKYGSPDGKANQGLTMTWCSSDPGVTCGRPSLGENYMESGYLQVETFGKNTIHLDAGGKQRRLYAAALDGEVERLAPKTSKAAF